MVYYLKINRDQSYTYRNLQHWLDIIAEGTDQQVYIICDNDAITETVQLKVDFRGCKCEFMKSINNMGDEWEFMPVIAEENWTKAAYAHLTTFYHAKEMKYESFWNIDADDTLICLKSARAFEVLKIAETYANRNLIDVFSFDMWSSKAGGNAWSFGISYVDNRIDWFKTICEYAKDSRFIIEPPRIRNVDNFFSNLRLFSDRSIETFCIDNLKFVHCANDMIFRPWGAGLFHWKKGKMIQPILRDFFNSPECGEAPINDQVIVLNIQGGVTDQETKEYLLEYCLPSDAPQIRMRDKVKT